MVVGMDEREERRPDQIVRLLLELPRIRFVDERETAAGIRAHDQLVLRFDEPAIARLAGP